MSIIQRLYNQSAVTEREDFIDVAEIKRAYAPFIVTPFACHIQPLAAELTQQIEGAFGKAWLMFCNNVDLKEGDKLIVDGTTEYRVGGSEVYTHSRNPHMEVILIAFKN